jgi:cold shock CspA family protein
MAIGVLGGYDPAIGYWFIEPRGGGPRVFAHPDDLGEPATLKPGVSVRFSVIQGVSCLKAYNVTMMPSTEHNTAKRRWGVRQASRIAKRTHDRSTSSPFANLEEASWRAFADEVMSVLMSQAPGMTYPEALNVCAELTGKAVRHGWLDVDDI